MKLVQILALSGLMAIAPVFAAAPAAPVAAAAPSAAQISAMQGLMAAMQTEKMMRTTAGMSRYSSEKHRLEVVAKLAKVPPAEIHRRLAAPVARFVTTETALEMTRFYATPYGQRVLFASYNSGPSITGPGQLKMSKAEAAALKRPAYVQASHLLQRAERAIKRETFVLLGQISNGK
ncbi:hypothetical protein [Massilia glaciei]|uniref:DUF2059 domain-containing protein n=1 Tax=Massilia glaciei TaxID=1524097 RepID=A0A2U2HP94_9BURK|nr:hypothetical protein [Massilia glaciei]PWF49344.1 hypothetical protein C7C56_006870 [Massilia glaciei]